MKLLVGHDGSAVAGRALEMALARAERDKAFLYVVTSLNKGTESRLHDIREKEKLLDEIKEQARTRGIDCDTVLLIRGMDAGRDLVDFAADNEVDLIFVGLRKRSRVEKMILGSTARYVILNAECPVTTVK